MDDRAQSSVPPRFDSEGDATRRTWLANERTWLAWVRTGLTSTAVAVGIGKVATGFGIEVDLVVSLPGVERAVAETIVERAHLVCPYSNATRNNIDVRLSVA